MSEDVHAENQDVWKSIVNAFKPKCLVRKFVNAQNVKIMDFLLQRHLEKLVRGIICFVNYLILIVKLKRLNDASQG